MSSVSDSNAPGTVDQSKVLSAAIWSVVGAAVANTILFFIVNAVYDIPEGFLPLSLVPILLLTVVGTSLGAVVYWFLSRRSSTPARTYIIVAIIALVLSIIPNILSAINPTAMPFPFPAVSSAFLVLILFHVVAAVVSVWILISRSTR